MDLPDVHLKSKSGKGDLGLDDINRKRLERDLQDLQKLIALHFEQRKIDEADLDQLKTRITKRQDYRTAQITKRAAREAQRLEDDKVFIFYFTRVCPIIAESFLPK